MHTLTLPADGAVCEDRCVCMQVKCLRVLQYFPPPEDPAVARSLNDVLRRIITGSEVAKNVNKNNAQHAIVFEAIALALALEADPELLTAGRNSLALLLGYADIVSNLGWVCFVLYIGHKGKQLASQSGRQHCYIALNAPLLDWNS